MHTFLKGPLSTLDLVFADFLSARAQIHGLWPKGVLRVIFHSIGSVVNMKLRFLAFAQKLSGFFNIWLLLAILVFAGMLAQSGGFNFFGGNEVAEDGKYTISGRVRVSDGDSLRFGDERVRLIGIDAPELDQTCTNSNGVLWPCGKVSQQRLLQLAKDGALICTYERRDRFDRALAVCMVDGVDIGGTMVLEGLAVSYDDYPDQEADARRSGKGMWQGEFITPRNWRRGER